MEKDMVIVRPGKYFLIRSQLNDKLVLESDPLDENSIKVSSLKLDWVGNNDNQLWFYNSYQQRIFNKKTLSSLEAAGNKVVVSKKFNADKNLYLDTGLICLNNSKLAVELVGGTKVELKLRNDQNILQMWKIQNRPALYFYIKSRGKPGLVVDVRGDDKSAGAKVILYENKGDMADNQLWCEDERGRLRSKMNDFLVDVNKSNEVVLNPYLSEDKGGWVVEDNCRIVSLSNSNMILSSKSGNIFLGGPRVVAMSRAAVASEADALWDFAFLPRQSISIAHEGSGKVFMIRSRRSGKTLEVVGEAVVKGSALQLVHSNLVPSNSLPKQQFYSDDLTGTIRSCLRNFAIEATETGLILSGFDPYNKMQGWLLRDNMLINKHDPSLIIQTDPEDNDKISVGQDQGLDYQQWEFCHVPAKCFYIESFVCDKVLDVRGNNASAGAYVILYERNKPTSANQLWYEDEHGLLRSKLNGYVLDTSEDKAKVVPFNPENLDQYWSIVGDRIQNKNDTEMVIDVKGESRMNGASLIKYKFHGGENQRWKFVYVD